MNVEPHDSIEELHTLVRTETNARLARRIQGVWLARRGLTCPEIMTATAAKRRTVQQWIARYNRGGIEELTDKPRCGAPRKLPAPVEQRVLQRIGSGPQPGEEVSVLNGPAIRDIIEREFGVLYSLTGLYDWLHRMGFSYLAPRGRHEKADSQAQEAFKKTSPQGWLKSLPTIPASESKSTSRTKRGSAGKGR